MGSYRRAEESAARSQIQVRRGERSAAFAVGRESGTDGAMRLGRRNMRATLGKPPGDVNDTAPRRGPIPREGERQCAPEAASRLTGPLTGRDSQITGISIRNRMAEA